MQRNEIREFFRKNTIEIDGVTGLVLHGKSRLFLLDGLNRVGVRWKGSKCKAGLCLSFPVPLWEGGKR